MPPVYEINNIEKKLIGIYVYTEINTNMVKNYSIL